MLWILLNNFRTECGINGDCRKAIGGNGTTNAQEDVSKLRNLDEESLDGIAGGYIHFESREGGVTTYSIIDDKTGEELERTSTASADDYEAMMAAKTRAIELGLSPKKVNDYQLSNLRNS